MKFRLLRQGRRILAAKILAARVGVDDTVSIAMGARQASARWGGDHRGRKDLCYIATYSCDRDCAARGGVEPRLDCHGQRAIAARKLTRQLDHESTVAGAACRSRRRRVRRQAARDRRIGERNRRSLSRRIRSGDQFVAPPRAAARGTRSYGRRGSCRQNLRLRRLCRLGAQGRRHRRLRIRSAKPTLGACCRR